jgi:peptide/nickel transport system permease protein
MSTVPTRPNASPPIAPPEAGKVKTRGYWRETWQRFRQNRLAMLALVYVGFMVIVAIFSPAIAGTRPIVCKYKGAVYFPSVYYYNRSWENPIFRKDRFRNNYYDSLKKKDPDSWAVWPLFYQDPNRSVMEGEFPNQPPNPAMNEGKPNRFNWFGTDQAGIDVLAQLVHGTRTALLVGFVSMGIAATIGITVGALAGYFGGWVDMLLSRLIEVVMSIPALVLILALIAVVEKPTIWHVMAVLGCTGWTSIARLTRGEFLRLREMDFVTAARAMGSSQIRIMAKHIFRNALAPVLVPITFGVASAILVESAISFLGIHASASSPSWGTLLEAGRSNFQMWWLILFPGAAIFVTVLAYNLIGEGLQAATDPRLKQAAH